MAIEALLMNWYIQPNLQIKEKRKVKLDDRVTQLSRSNSHIDIMNQKWNQSWEEKTKENLIKNCQKAKVIESKQRKKQGENQ